MQHFSTNQIYIYPIKSLGYIIKSHFEFDAKGLRYDRNWMVVDREHRMVSQREFPNLNLISCMDIGMKFRLFKLDNPSDFIDFDKEFHGTEVTECLLWGKSIKATQTLPDISEWLSDYLKSKVFLVGNAIRKKNLQEFNISMEAELAFQDSCPVHLVNLTSVEFVSSNCLQEINPLQFRANVYLKLEEAFQEDVLDEIIINDRLFKKIKACERCIMATLSPGSAKFQKEPLNWLSKHRKQGNKVNFGIYLLPMS